MKPLKILIVDDSEDDRYLYRRSLDKGQNAAFEMIDCIDGEEGLKKIESEKPDCVLLDYSLPGRDGIEVLKRLRLDEPFLPVVILTGQGNETLAVRAMQEGAQNYISKASITPETLRRVIRMSIEHAAMEQSIFEQKQSLEIFTRAMAHDLKEPVRTIKSFLEILDNPHLPPEKVKAYNLFVRRAAEKLDVLIDSVYTLLRSDTKATNACAACSADEALSIAKNNLHALINQRKAVLTGTLAVECGMPVEHLSRIFQNLISNAIQHSENEPRIHVSLEERNGRILFKIADNGPGIPPENRKKLFQPFAKLSRNSENLGMGLSICKHIVETFDGSISFESEPGKGTTFLIELPKSCAPANSAQNAAQETAAQNGKREAGVARLMLVDDSPADTELARYGLFEEGKIQCEFVTAANGHEALTLLTRARQNDAPIDLVLLDINMPELDGFETLAEIRKNPPLAKTTVFMCTTSSYEGDRAKALKMGANGYIVKPLTGPALTNALAKVGNLFCQETAETLILRRTGETGGAASYSKSTIK